MLQSQIIALGSKTRTESVQAKQNETCFMLFEQMWISFFEVACK